MFDINKMSPGRSWYQDSVAPLPAFAPLEENIQADVAIIGGGSTGLSAACHLAKAGVNVALCECSQLGGGASGRNGGQLGSGQRQWVEELEPIYGFERTKALFDLAENAKAHLLNFASDHNIDIEYQTGQLSVAHKKRYVENYRQHVEVMARYGYHQLQFMDKQQMAARLGSNRYFGGLRDEGTGHIHPLKFVFGTALAANAAGAKLYEHTPVTGIEQQGGKIIMRTPRGAISTEKLLIATNGMGGTLETTSAARVLPIRSFIGATEPLDQNSAILPHGEAVGDLRFFVRYFCKKPGNRLLFGGSEAYGSNGQPNENTVRAQMCEIYPQLKDIKFSHIWGGTVGITVERMPFVREVAANITFCGGYCGHGLMLSSYCGKLYADSLLGQNEHIRLMQDLKISRFPGGLLRAPLLFLALHWFSLLDRI